MPEFRVHMSAVSSFSVTVEADDYDEAIEKAYEEHAPNVCAQCSCWGQKWSLDLGESFEAESVDLDGEQVYDSGEMWTRQQTKR